VVAAFYVVVSFSPALRHARRMAAAGGGRCLRHPVAAEGSLTNALGLRLASWLSRSAAPDPRLADLSPNSAGVSGRCSTLKLRIKAKIFTMGRPEIQPRNADTTFRRSSGRPIAGPRHPGDHTPTPMSDAGSSTGAIDPGHRPASRDFQPWGARSSRSAAASPAGWPCSATAGTL